MTSYAEALNSLWNVQALDRRILDSRRRIASAERLVARAAKKFDDAEKALSDAHDALQHMRAREKEHEDELARLDARVKQLEAQGTEAGDAAAEKQRAKIDEIELAGIELLGEIEAQMAVRDTRRAEVDEVRRVSQSETAESEKVIAEERAALEELLAERNAECAKVDPKLLEVYEGVNDRQPGNALTRVQGTYCGGCNGELTLHLIHQVRRRAEIIRCPLCGRILDVEESPES